MYRPMLFASMLIISFQSTLAKSLPIDHDARLKMGFNVSFNQYGYDMKNGIMVMPQAFYDNHRWYLEGGEAGGYWYKDRTNHWRATLAYDSRHFNPKTAPNHLKNMEKRQWSAMVGSSYMKITPIGGFKVQLETDLLNRHQGKTIKLAHLSRFQQDKMTFYPEFGLRWYDKKYNQYYYGISQEEVDKSNQNISAFQAKSSLNFYAMLSINYKINPQIDGFINQRIEYLGGNLKNSPLVNQKLDSKTKIGFNYKF